MEKDTSSAAVDSSIEQSGNESGQRCDDKETSCGIGGVTDNQDRVCSGKAAHHGASLRDRASLCVSSKKPHGTHEMAG